MNPKPTNLKLLQGTYRAHREGKKREARPEPATPTPPDNLADEARAEWERIAPELESLGLLTRIDRAALSAYCECWADWVKASREVQQRGMIFKTAAGNVIENPYYSIKKRAAELMHKFLIEFGMTPASRTRINSEPAGGGEAAPESRWKDFA